MGDRDVRHPVVHRTVPHNGIKMVHCTFPTAKPQPNFLHVYIKHFFIVLIYNEFAGNTAIM